MDGQAEYENQQNHAKNVATEKPTSGQYLNQKGGGHFAAALLLVQVFERCWSLGFLYDFVDFHILPQHMFGLFCNLKLWLGII